MDTNGNIYASDNPVPKEDKERLKRHFQEEHDRAVKEMEEIQRLREAIHGA